MVDKVKCTKCNYSWLPRVKKPVECPKCKRRDWENKKEVEVAFT